MPTNPLADWFATALGAYLLEKERAYLDDVTPDIFGFHALQLGLPQFDLLRENRMTHRMKIDVGGGVDVRARGHELPIATQSIDLAVLPHVLEFAPEPHAVLREIDRVMMPEGRIIILGFNPWSLWGLRSAIGPARHETPWNGKFVSLLRVKDWLALLGYEVSAGRLVCYAPPVKKEKWLKRLAFMEPAGDRWWAVGGAVYMLQAIKRVRGMRLLTPAWHEAQAREKRVAMATKREGTAASSRAGPLHIVK
ncbi:MAG: methyltransferase domain-containing protein [Betaproteobacteria bacterium]|nr:methyltransferase domain-containing protein [Betaproteobacteria bacterium]